MGEERNRCPLGLPANEMRADELSCRRGLEDVDGCGLPSAFFGLHSIGRHFPEGSAAPSQVCLPPEPREAEGFQSCATIIEAGRP